MVVEAFDQDSDLGLHRKAGLVTVSLSLVLVALLLAVIHDFVLGPRAGRPGADPALRARASWVARVNVLVVLAIVALGLALRG